jgi:predicted AAA+ superfamily ATPase
MSLKPWREIAVPHEDVLKGTFQQAEFAADLSRVHDRTATPEYQDPKLFFERTFITEGMGLLLDSVVKRLTSGGGDPVIQLQTAFGGGKTHTMLAVYHLTNGEAPASELAGIPPILDKAGVTELPNANIAVLDGNKLAPNIPQKHGEITARTLWGELAWQLGREAGYALVKDADESGTSPGKEVLADLLAQNAPCVILIDEMVAYTRQFEEGKSYTGGSYDSNISFIQALTESLKAVPNAVLLASLPESDKEAGSSRGINALRTLEHYFGRVQALWKPVATEEAFEIVRRRLFEPVHDRHGAEAVCRAYADYYIANGADFPQETQESRYFDRLKNAYPIHPEVFVRLYEDWSTLDNFQRTRGVLKMMAKVIHRLWSDGNNDAMIMPGSLPLYDADTRNEMICYLSPGWDPVVESDIDGDRAETTLLENSDTRLGSVQACRRTARTIFLGSAPTPNQMVRGLETQRVILGCAQPGQQISLYEDALKRLADRLHFLNSANDRFWFDTRPNLRREMEERKKRFHDKDDILPAIRDGLAKIVGHGVLGGTHIFTPSADIPDDWALRLVVLPPDSAYSKAGHGAAIKQATEILKNRGDQPRQKQNRLIFLAADYDTISRLKDQVRSMLAWGSIVEDVNDMKLNLDAIQSRQASRSRDESTKGVTRMLAEAYKWLLSPRQDAQPGKGISDIEWEHFPLNTSATSIQQEIVRVLKENELVLTEWAPIHLTAMLTTWFWKDAPEAGAMEVWQKSCQYLYLPRFRDEGVFRAAVEAGTGSRDFFGLAQGKDGEKYVGFSFNKDSSPILDSALLLIEPTTAADYEAARQQAVAGSSGATAAFPTGNGSSLAIAEPPNVGESEPFSPTTPSTLKRRFYGTIDLDPVQAKKQFTDLVDEVILQFTSRADVTVKISIEIHAESDMGFDEGVQRTVKENSKVLGFGNVGFEEG